VVGIRGQDLVENAAEVEDRLIIRPSKTIEPDELYVMEKWSDMAWAVYLRGNCSCYQDLGVCEPGHINSKGELIALIVGEE
jgi:hypothetical protein